MKKKLMLSALASIMTVIALIAFCGGGNAMLSSNADAFAKGKPEKDETGGISTFAERKKQDQTLGSQCTASGTYCCTLENGMVNFYMGVAFPL